MIDQAMHFAVVAHSGVMRKGTNQPYLLHVIEVATITAGILRRSGLYDEDVVCAAILHDVGEDARVGREAFATIFNQRVAELIRAMTEDKSKAWKERKQHTIEELIRETDMDKKTIALADKLSNIRSLRTDYDQLGEELWERFTEKRKANRDGTTTRWSTVSGKWNICRNLRNSVNWWAWSSQSLVLNHSL